MNDLSSDVNLGLRFEPPVSGDSARASPGALVFRPPDDPMRLYSDVIKQVDQYFLTRSSTFLSGQREALCTVTEAILSAQPGTTLAVPLEPGGGKSTELRSVAIVLARLFCDMTDPIAQRIGGVIFVVQKSSEAHELDELCRNAADGELISIVIESANDFNLGQGGCANGTATCYAECKRRDCPDYGTCELFHLWEHTQETPIIIILHASYAKTLEKMQSLMEWSDGQSDYTRSLLIVDELPDLFDETVVSLKSLNQAEVEIDDALPSYSYVANREKEDLLYRWNKHVRIPFRTLTRSFWKQHQLYGLVTPRDMEDAGFNWGELETLDTSLSVLSSSAVSRRILFALIQQKNLFFSIGRSTTLFLPRLRRITGEDQPATILLSGTAALSPEVADNPTIQMVDAHLKEDFSRLTIYVQRGDVFSTSKTALASNGNFNAAVAWVKARMDELIRSHNKVLVVTYKSFAKSMWNELKDYHAFLIPYIDGSGQPQDNLPYFNGLHGSNQYLEATAVICAGLLRFEPSEYLSRAIALDHVGAIEVQLAELKAAGVSKRLDQIPAVMDLQDITLARDLVQLMYRCSLRVHGGNAPIVIWLSQVPSSVLNHLSASFPGCRIEEVRDLPDDCYLAVASAREGKDGPTQVATALAWLQAWDGHDFTPDEFRRDTGLSQEQFKEVKKATVVRKLWNRLIETSGSGRNTVYRRKANAG